MDYDNVTVFENPRKKVNFFTNFSHETFFKNHISAQVPRNSRIVESKRD